MIAAKNLIRKVPVAKMNSVSERQSIIGKERDTALLDRCEQCWLNLSDFREQGDRAVEFTYGDQWADKIRVNGVVMTQREYAQKMGNIVLQTNQIKNKVDTIVGVLVKEKNEPVCNARDRDEQQYGEIMTNALQANCNKNKMDNLYIKFMKDLCIRGLAVSKESYEYRNGRLDSWTDYCEPNCLFFDSEMSDPRFGDISLIGQFYDMPFEQLTARFVKTKEDYSLLHEIYGAQADRFRMTSMEQMTDRRDNESQVFRTPYDLSRCRIFEVWTHETKPRIRLHDFNEGSIEIIDADDHVAISEYKAENRRRKALAKKVGMSMEETPFIEDEFFIDEFWYCRILAVDGTIIWEGESPYADRQHPFSLVATPMVSGRIAGYMNDAIDHNIAINRAIILQDWLIRRQAKGIPVVPEKIVPGHNKEAFAKAWSSLDQIAFVDIKPGDEGLFPKIISGNQTNFNASELIATYRSLMEESTAVSGAIQGKTPYAGTSGTLYAQQTQNSSTPIAALLTQFHSFLEDLHTKKMKNIALFYTTDRFASIVGDLDGVFGNANLKLNEVGDIECDLAIKESTETPVYRAIINDDAKEFLMKGLISFEEYLEIADVPYADKILQKRQARQAEVDAAKQGQMPVVQQPMEEPTPQNNSYTQ